MSNNGTPYDGVRTSTDGKTRADYEHVSFPKSQDTEWPKRHKARSNKTPRERTIPCASTAQ